MLILVSLSQTDWKSLFTVDIYSTVGIDSEPSQSTSRRSQCALGGLFL
ncbi:hypothetical protein CVCC1112_3201 [Paenarthrobacter nicotinovorans]|nr:hypothetical protein CVCC1112_3201 [Paenarthrobacter nicotinovorans]